MEDSTCKFLTILPREIRDLVYELVVPIPEPDEEADFIARRKYRFFCEIPLKESLFCSIDIFLPQPSLGLTCRQLRHEVLPLFHKKNKFHIVTPLKFLSDLNKYVPLFLQIQLRDWSGQARVDLTFDVPEDFQVDDRRDWGTEGTLITLAHSHEGSESITVMRLIANPAVHSWINEHTRFHPACFNHRRDPSGVRKDEAMTKLFVGMNNRIKRTFNLMCDERASASNGTYSGFTQ